MSKCLVSIGHAVRILAFFHSSATVVVGIGKFTGQFVSHGFSRSFLGEVDQPANSQSVSSLRTNLNRHLIGGTTNPTRFHLKPGTNLLHSFFKHHNRIGLSNAGLDHIHGAVENATGDALLATLHQGVDKLRNQHTIKTGVRLNPTPCYKSFSRHLKNSLSHSKQTAYLGRLAPYLERPCLRLATPSVSKVPRIIW